MTCSAESVRELLDLYGDYGSSNYIGENVTQVQHALQAAELARDAGYQSEIILGAFFHDVGHLIGEKNGLDKMVTAGNVIGSQHHAKRGQEYLESLGFAGNMSLLTGMHVEAKRYLVATVDGYYEKLSDASKMTLVHQGGAMSPDEVEAFSTHPLKDIIIQLRRWDEQAKDVTKYDTPIQVENGLKNISQLLFENYCANSDSHA